MIGFFIILGICSILVPSPCATSPPTPFSRKLVTAKPTMWQAQPATAAPPAIAKTSGFWTAVFDVAIAIHIAADDVGIVKSIPITTDTNIPVMIFTASPALIAITKSFANRSTSFMNGHATNTHTKLNANTPIGTKMISSLVLPA